MKKFKKALCCVNDKMSIINDLYRENIYENTDDYVYYMSMVVDIAKSCVNLLFFLKLNLCLSLNEIIDMVKDKRLTELRSYLIKMKNFESLNEINNH